MGWLPPSCVPYHYFENNSSPRGRGKQDQSPRTHPTPRLIPAWAEKTAAAPGPESQPRAHPRVGGENGISRGGLTLLGGSSPRGRGKRRMVLTTGWPVRLIPARAGKTNTNPTLQSVSQAHPRAGGENGLNSQRVIAGIGSSPRGRGKHFLTCAFIERIGQILETLELAVSSGSYSVWVACATDAPQDQVRSIGLVLPSSRGAS